MAARRRQLAIGGRNCALRAASFHVATLWVHYGNSRARAFYEHHGWRSDGAEVRDARFCIGCGAAGDERWDVAALIALYVAPASWRLGVGSELHNAALARMCARRRRSEDPALSLSKERWHI